MPHKLLLADDSVTIQRVIELTFSSEDVQVITVGDGEEAIARIPVDLPDIVLADIAMPRRTGYEVAAFVKGRPDLAHIPVLLLAGAFEPVDEARAQQVGSEGVLGKPFEPQQVITRVRELLQAAKANASRAPAPPKPAPAPEPSGQPAASEPLSQPPPPEPPPQPVSAVPPPADLLFRDEWKPKETDLALTDEPARAEVVDESLDDYFNRLDAAFANLGTSGPAASTEAPAQMTDLDVQAPEETRVPTIDELLAVALPPAPAIDLPLNAPPAAPVHPVPPVSPPPVEPPDVTPTRAPGAAAMPVSDQPEAPPPTSISRSVVTDAFSALLAAEEGQSTPSVRLTAAQAEPVVTEAMLDEITRRVLERLAPGATDALHEVVRQIVSEVAERLVEQEIRRIRSQD